MVKPRFLSVFMKQLLFCSVNSQLTKRNRTAKPVLVDPGYEVYFGSSVISMSGKNRKRPLDYIDAMNLGPLVLRISKNCCREID